MNYRQFPGTEMKVSALGMGTMRLPTLPGENHPIDEEKAKSAEYEKCSVEETAEKRAEFNKIKDSLIEEWEEKTGKKWPTYQEDVYSSNGSLIRRAGDKYDAHHIQPLSMGGKNEAGNITPLHAECHYDRQGVHSPDSAYAKLEQKLGA